MNNKPLIVILGPTATGKTKLGLALAQKFNGEIISADSRQIYKEIDIGSGRGRADNSRIKKENGVWVEEGIPIHLYNTFSPSVQVNVLSFKELAEEIIADLYSEGKIPFVVGGTGFYISALIGDVVVEDIPANIDLRQKSKDLSLDDLVCELRRANPEIADKTDLKNRRRVIRAIERERYRRDNPDYQSPQVTKRNALLIGLTCPPERLAEEIRQRTLRMLDDGLIDEVRRMIQIHGQNAPALEAIGYKQLLPFILGEEPLEMGIQRKIADEIGFAKRQITWFKRNADIKWFDVSSSDYQNNFDQSIPELVNSYLEGNI